LALLAQFDKARERYAVGGITQNRVRDQRSFERCNGEPRREREKAECENETDRALPQQDRGRQADRRQA
jgi:hypothetical protein